MQDNTQKLDEVTQQYVNDLNDCGQALDLQADELDVNLLRYEMLYSESEVTQVRVSIRILRVVANQHRIAAMQVVAQYNRLSA